MASNNLPVKSTTFVVMNEHFKSLNTRLWKRRAWIGVAFTAATLVAGIFGDDDLFENLIPALLVAALFWVFAWATISDNVNRAKYEATAAKLDEVLEARDGRWERCEESSDGWAIHFGAAPYHETEASEDAEETEK